MPKEIETNIPFIRNLQMASEAHEETDLNPLFELLDPKEDSREMGKSFVDVIGYNPITYYTEKAASDVFSDTEEMLAEYPKTVEKLKEIEDTIIAELVDHTETTRAQYAYFGIKGKIRNMIRELGEVPNSKLDEVMDALERKYNLNYKEKQPAASVREEREDREERENRPSQKADRGTSFQNTKEHPVKLRGLPDDDEVEELVELDRADFRMTKNNDDEEDELIFPSDDESEDDDEDTSSDYSYDPFEDDDDEPRLKDNDYFV